MKRYKVYTKEKGIVESDNYDEITGLNLYREDGPAYIRYYNNGKVSYEEYWYNNKKHRLDGPAIIQYDMYGNITNEVYWINNICYTKENYNKELLKLKVKLL